MPLPPQDSLDRFQGKVAVVTGGASGMGRESSIRLGREGASVVVAGLPDDERGAETVSLVEEAGGNAVYVGVDVTREADATRWRRRPSITSVAGPVHRRCGDFARRLRVRGSHGW